jgi:CRP/FNR family cyclic AMP-dependent transcriptional regulator
MPILLGSLGLSTTLLIMGVAIPALTALAYPWIRALDSQALGQLAQIEPRVAILQSLDIFAGATRAALESLAKSAVEEKVAAGTVIIREGDEADDFFVLIDGQVEIIAAGEAGTERVIRVLNPPDYFGEIGLLERRPRTATVKAVTECTLYRINGNDFIDALTVATLSPSALASSQLRLARTHPSLSMTFGQNPPGADAAG